MRLLRVYWRALRILLVEEKKLTFFLLGMCVLLGISQTMEPLLFGRIVDALGQPGTPTIFHWLLVWAVIGTLNIGTSVFLSVSADRLAHRNRLRTLDDIFESVISLPHSYHSKHGSGKVIHAILSGTDQLFHLWLSFLREHFPAIIGICTLVPLAVSLDWRMAVVLLTLSIIYLIANIFVVRKTHGRQARIQNYHENLTGRIGDVITNVTVVQSFTRLIDEIHALQRMTGELLTAQYPILTWWGLLSVITRVASTFSMVVILALGSWLVTIGETSVGQVVSFVSFSGILIARLEQISGFIARLIAQGPALENFFKLMDENSFATETPHASPLAHVTGKIRFDNVSFRYPESEVGVHNLNFAVEPGQLVALVGPSGSGKTTTMALLQRLFDPHEGQILIDGRDIRTVTLSSLRQSIATVFQDAGLFNRSILENIRVGRPSASLPEVIAAAEAANAHDFIQRKPGGYDFVIGERGAALSGGERQRVAIARAILKHAPILIFDEATSALDNQTEKRIQEAILNLRSQNKSAFVIAHRLSTVVAADNILVFQNGRIVEEGTFTELRSRGGLFAELVKHGELTPPTPTHPAHHLGAHP